jgi:hypothetical protein
LEERRTDSAVVYELSDPETGRLVGVARSEAREPVPPGPILAFQRALFDSPSTRWLAILVGLVLIPFGMIGAALGLLSPPPRRGRPRLDVRRPDGDEAILAIRQSSGMLYDSRVVYDDRGRAVARFRGPSKMALGRMGFGMVDLRGAGEELRDDGALPWLGRVDAPGDGVYRVCLVGDPDAGRVVERVERYDIEAGPGLRGNPTGTLLLLAAALALAWRPPPD